MRCNAMSQGAGGSTHFLFQLFGQCQRLVCVNAKYFTEVPDRLQLFSRRNQLGRVRFLIRCDCHTMNVQKNASLLIFPDKHKIAAFVTGLGDNPILWYNQGIVYDGLAEAVEELL